MQHPPIIQFRHMDSSPAVEASIRGKIQRLQRFHPRITSCKVVVGKDHEAHRKGNLYRVRIDIGIPGREIVVDRTGPHDHAHEDVHVAISQAFDAARRRIEDAVRIKRADVKTHEVPTHGWVSSLSPDHGFIRTSEGQDVYFHRNSVPDGAFDRLECGAEVRLAVSETEGEKGYQATTVHPVGRHHPVG